MSGPELLKGKRDDQLCLDIQKGGLEKTSDRKEFNKQTKKENTQSCRNTMNKSS